MPTSINKISRKYFLFSNKKWHRVADLEDWHVKWAPVDSSGAADPAPAAYTCIKMRSGRSGGGTAAADLSKWSAFDWCGGRIHVRTASGPHVATIIYPQFSTTHFYLLITGLILTYIPESFNPNLVETQNIILNPKKRVGALLKFRVQETRKTCRIFIEMEEVLPMADGNCSVIQNSPD